jgi:shikimate kinase
MPNVVLIGPPGSGKSSVGRALARITGLSHSDTDSLIEAKVKKKISEIFVEDGEAVFRAIEADVVTGALVEEVGVLSLGGGSVMHPDTQALLRGCGALIVFLEVGIGQAAPRIGFNQDRPMLLINPRQTWLKLMEERLPIYQSLANVTFSTDSKKAQEVAEQIAALLEVSHG